MNRKFYWFFLVLFSLFGLLVARSSYAEGNTRIESFQQAKRILASIYADHRETFYCAANFDARGRVSLPEGFVASSHAARAERMEWEHVVPAENFGRAFAAWREGDARCVDSRGKAFRGRRCAERVSPEYRRMQADMHNLVPAIGAVNAARKNDRFGMLPWAQSAFGSCPVKIEGQVMEPPQRARGMIARIYKYMAWAYPLFQPGRPTRQLMDAWDQQYPVNAWECERTRRIAAAQGNDNPFVAELCVP